LLAVRTNKLDFRFDEHLPEAHFANHMLITANHIRNMLDSVVIQHADRTDLVTLVQVMDA
jgi:hypothetical protein